MSLQTAKITLKMKTKFTYLYIFKSPFCVNKEVIGCGWGHVPKNTPPPLHHCEAERYRCQVGCENSRARENWSRRGNNNNKHPGGRAQRMRGPYHRDDCALPGADDQSRPFNSITRDPTGRRCAELIKPKRSGWFRCLF